ncbi:MAG: HAD family hydrolase [Candidatus Rokuibacteriota bacterium]|nr:MAG: HAD family hydrolase [Candidatus Rokubacteria bacterium]
MSSRVLLFDLDGTLTDSRPGIVRCFRHALESLERPCPPDDVLASFIGPPLRGAFATLLDSSDPALIDAAVARYRARLSSTGLYENQVYDGVPEMLERSKPMASALFIVTAKLTVFAERVVRHFGLDHHFAAIYGSELDGRFEEKADLVAHVLAIRRIPSEAAIMIGDRAVDIRAARANGIRAVGVLWGYGSERELVDTGVDELCVAPGDMASCLARIATLPGRSPLSR